MKSLPHKGEHTWACTSSPVHTLQTPPCRPLCTRGSETCSREEIPGEQAFMSPGGALWAIGQEILGHSEDAEYSGQALGLGPDRSCPVSSGTAGGGPEPSRSGVEPKEYLELKIKPLWKSHLKSCSLCSYPQILGDKKKKKKKKKKGISYLNLTTSEGLWSTFPLVLQGKIISPLALKGKLDQLCEKSKMMYFINFELVPRLSPALC